MKCKHLEKIDTSVGSDMFDHPTYKCYCHKKNCEVLEYKCAKCNYREFPVRAMVVVGVGRCDECPCVEQERTPRAGYAFDYFCKACRDMNGKPKLISSYVEYDSEIPEVPDWCPFFCREDEWENL